MLTFRWSGMGSWFVGGVASAPAPGAVATPCSVGGPDVPEGVLWHARAVSAGSNEARRAARHMHPVMVEGPLPAWYDPPVVVLVSTHAGTRPLHLPSPWSGGAGVPSNVLPEGGLPNPTSWMWLMRTAERARDAIGVQHRAARGLGGLPTDAPSELVRHEADVRRGLETEWAVDCVGAWFLLGVAHLCRGAGTPQWASLGQLCLRTGPSSSPSSNQDRETAYLRRRAREESHAIDASWRLQRVAPRAGGGGMGDEHSTQGLPRGARGVPGGRADPRRAC